MREHRPRGVQEEVKEGGNVKLGGKRKDLSPGLHSKRKALS